MKSFYIMLIVKHQAHTAVRSAIRNKEGVA